MLRNYIEQKMREIISRGTIFLTTCALILGLTQPALAKNEQLIAEKQQSALETWAQGMIFTLTQPESGEQQGVENPSCSVKYIPSEFISNSPDFVAGQTIPDGWPQAECTLTTDENGQNFVVVNVPDGPDVKPSINDIFFPIDENVGGIGSSGIVVIITTGPTSASEACYWGAGFPTYPSATDNDVSKCHTEQIVQTNPLPIVLDGRNVRISVANSNTQLAFPYRINSNGEVEIEFHKDFWMKLTDLEQNLRERFLADGVFDVPVHTLITSITDEQANAFPEHRPLPQAEVHSGAKAEVVASPLSTDEPIDPITGLPIENTPVPESQSVLPPRITYMGFLLDENAKALMQNDLERQAHDTNKAFELLAAFDSGASPAEIERLVTELTAKESIVKWDLSTIMTRHLETSTAHGPNPINPDHRDMRSYRFADLKGIFEILEIRHIPYSDNYRIIARQPDNSLIIYRKSKNDLAKLVSPEQSDIVFMSNVDLPAEVKALYSHIFDSVVSGEVYPTIFAVTPENLIGLAAKKDPSLYVDTMGTPPMVDALLVSPDGKEVVQIRIPQGYELSNNGWIKRGETYWVDATCKINAEYFSPYNEEMRRVVTDLWHIDSGIFELRLLIPMHSVLPTDLTKAAAKAAQKLDGQQ